MNLYGFDFEDLRVQLHLEAMSFADKASYIFRLNGWTWDESIPDADHIEKHIHRLIDNLDPRHEHPYAESGRIVVECYYEEEDVLIGGISIKVDEVMVYVERKDL